MHKNEPDNHKSRWKRWLAIALAAAALLIAGLLFLGRYKPRAYQPQPPANPGQVSPYLTHKLGPDFVNQVQLDKPFELLVEQDGLNDIIKTVPWIEQFDGFAFTNPLVLFGDNAIYLMGTLEYKGFSSVLTLIARPHMLGDDRIFLNIESIRLGILPVTALAGHLAKIGFDQCRDCFQDDPHLGQVVRAIIYNEPFDPVFKIYDRAVRVTGMELQPQRLTLRFDPLPDSPTP